MRFLLSICLGLFSTFTLGQDFSIQNIPLRNASADIPSTARLTSDGQASVPLRQTPTTTKLFDAPSAVQSSCTQRNGKPCPAWLHKLVGQYPPVAARERWNGKPDGLFTIGNGRRALHPDKKCWMLFAAAHAGMWASTVMAVRNFPASKEQADSEYPAAAVLTGMDLLLFKTINPALPLGPPVYAMVHYSRAASK
jgi:hypothetical protein